MLPRSFVELACILSMQKSDDSMEPYADLYLQMEDRLTGVKLYLLHEKPIMPEILAHV
jgi:hypothetical protein